MCLRGSSTKLSRQWVSFGQLGSGMGLANSPFVTR
jgi:hypothetical protein